MHFRKNKFFSATTRAPFPILLLKCDLHHTRSLACSSTKYLEGTLVMTTISRTTGPRVDQSQRHKKVVTDRVKQPILQKVQKSSFSHGRPTQVQTGNETASRQGVQRTPAPQLAQPTQLQNMIKTGQYVQRGSRGASVNELQAMLNRAGAQPPLTVDGQFGPQTDRAVHNFQNKKNIKSDGIVGPQTLGYLLDPNGRSSQPRPIARPETPGQPVQPGQPNQPSTPVQPTQPGTEAPADARIGRVAGMENTTPEFRQKVAQIADRLGMNPQHLMAIMSFETGGRFSPSIRNRTSGATGLIQFMPSTARGLGTSTAALSRMSPMQQLDYVEKYLKPFAGKMNTLEDAYMAVLWPAAVGKGPNHSLFRSPTIQYRQNQGLDTNRNGVVTAREAASKVRARILR